MSSTIASMLSFGVSYAAWASDPVSADYACEEQEGIHYSTLHMPIKKTKTYADYYYKYESGIYAVVPQIPRKQADGSIEYKSLALYRYDCLSHKATRLSSNLKKKVTSIYSPVYGTDAPETYLDELSFGEITSIQDGVVELYLGIPQTGISSQTIHLLP